MMERVSTIVPADQIGSFAASHVSSNVDNGASAPNAGPDCTVSTSSANARRADAREPCTVCVR